MVWLQSNEKFDLVARYGHQTGDVVIESRSQRNNLQEISTSGVYSYLSRTFVAVYKNDGRLYLRVGALCFEFTKEILTTVSGSVTNRLLSISKAGSKVIDVKYTLDASQVIKNDPTPFVEDEDFDFGLFVDNISKSESRKRVILSVD